MRYSHWFYRLSLVVCLLGCATTVRGELVTTNFGSNLFEIDPVAGTVLRQYNRPIVTPFFDTTDFRGNGLLYGLQGSTLFSVDLGTPTITVTQIAQNVTTGDLAFAPNDQLFVANSSTLNRIDIGTGAVLSTLPVTLGGSSLTLQGIDFAPDGRLFGVSTQALFQIDTVTGIATRITPVGQNAIGTLTMTELDFGGDNVIRAVAFNTDRPLWAIDPSTGLGTSIFSTAPLGSPYSSVASRNLVVPEPSSLCLVTGLVTALSLRRSRARSRR